MRTWKTCSKEKSTFSRKFSLKAMTHSDKDLPSTATLLDKTKTTEDHPPFSAVKYSHFICTLTSSSVFHRKQFKAGPSFLNVFPDRGGSAESLIMTYKLHVLTLLKLLTLSHQTDWHPGIYLTTAYTSKQLMNHNNSTKEVVRLRYLRTENTCQFSVASFRHINFSQ